MNWPWQKPDTSPLECPTCGGTKFAPVSSWGTAHLWKGRAVIVPRGTDLVCKGCGHPLELSEHGLKSLRKPAPTRATQEGPAEERHPAEDLDSDLAMTRAERRRRDKK